MSMFNYGRMEVVRGFESPNSKENSRLQYRKPEQAVKEKLKVLRGFGIVNDDNADSMQRQLEKAIAEHPDVHFDRVLDGVARKLISEKLEGYDL